MKGTAPPTGEKRSAAPEPARTSSGEVRQTGVNPLWSALATQPLRSPTVQRYPACEPAAECPAREPGEEERSRTEPMQVEGVSNPGGPNGLVVANFAVASAAVKSDLAGNARFSSYTGSMAGRPQTRFEILGFTDCEGAESTNADLRARRAEALSAALPAGVQPQVTGAAGAPLADCLASNATAEGRTLNRSAFLRETGDAYDFEDQPVEVTPGGLQGVTSPASAYYVRSAPVAGQRIGMLTLSEMEVEILGEHGASVADLWFEVRFRPEDFELLRQRLLADLAARLPELQRRAADLQRQIILAEHGDARARVLLPRLQAELAEVSAEAGQIPAEIAGLLVPAAGTTGWLHADALGVVAMPYDAFLDLIAGFDADQAAAHPNESLRDRLTRLRQIGEDARLEGDATVGRGADLPGRTSQSDRPNDPAAWQLFLEAKQVVMPNGEVVDVHHFILGLDALALPAAERAEHRLLYGWLDVGQSYSAATWSGDVGGAVGDYVMHRSAVWERANTAGDNQQRLDFYFHTRVPEMDLLADIDAWGAFRGLPATPGGATTFTTLRQVIEAQYGPAGQTADEYEQAVAAGRSAGIVELLCHYGFGSPAGLAGQAAARAAVEEQVLTFGRAWYDFQSGYGTIAIGHTAETDRQIVEASGQMTDMYLEWLEELAREQGVTSLSCASPSD